MVTMIAVRMPSVSIHLNYLVVFVMTAFREMGESAMVCIPTVKFILCVDLSLY